MTEKPDFARLMQGVIPYLAINGAEQAAAFYKTAFGAVQHGDTVKDDKGRVMNLGLEINGGMIMLMDARLQGGTPEELPATSQGTTMQLITRDGDLWWNRAVAAGCKVTLPFHLEFWGDRYGRLEDPLDWPGPSTNREREDDT
jgi:PhnB protein